MNGLLIQARHALEAVVKRVHRKGMGGSALPLQIGRTDVRDQRQEQLEPGSVGGSGIELDSSGKQCCLIKALKAFALAFSRLSCSVSFSICSISLPSCYGFAVFAQHALSGGWRPEFIEQHSQGFTQCATRHPSWIEARRVACSLAAAARSRSMASGRLRLQLLRLRRPAATFAARSRDPVAS